MSTNDQLVNDLVEAIAPIIKKHAGGDGLSEADVIRLIEQHAPSGGDGDGVSEARILELINEHIPADAGGSLGELGDALRLAFDPENVDELETGSPDGQMHASTGWGPVYEAEQRCHLRGAVVDADERGTVTFRFYALADGDMDTEILNDGDPFRTRKVEVYGGEQYIPLEVTLDEGYYFVEKDVEIESGSSDVVPLRRSSGVDPDDINDGDAPINWIRGWHPDYRPSHDSAAYERFQDGDWHSNYHYLYNCEVGYNDTTTNASISNSTNTDENAG